MTTTTQASLQHHAEQTVERNALMIESAFRASQVRLDVTAIALDRAIAALDADPSLENLARLDAALESWSAAIITTNDFGIAVY